MTKCKKLYINEDICTLRFTKSSRKNSDCQLEDLYTIRGEMILIHTNRKKEVVEIELLGSQKAKKPCQEEKQ